ncbi:hypothetical protein JZ751_026259 [Albula glossodonta]|uniref:Uncharacterized protein n=1 Tax=Albula glossodonta TaxID=121402 RepID=A0A8T2PDW0_9TELE|nr:hypothetical protein JZ751_026259 [Albula glossodonta]
MESFVWAGLPRHTESKRGCRTTSSEIAEPWDAHCQESLAPSGYGTTSLLHQPARQQGLARSQAPVTGVVRGSACGTRRPLGAQLYLEDEPGIAAL